MAIVERLLPRHWGGRRLLQFLTGLALLALAFAVPAGATATSASPAHVSSAASTSVVSTSVDASAAAPAAEPEPAGTTVAVLLTGPVGVAYAPVAAPVAAATFADGERQRACGSRGPPRA